MKWATGTYDPEIVLPQLSSEGIFNTTTHQNLLSYIKSHIYTHIYYTYIYIFVTFSMSRQSNVISVYPSVSELAFLLYTELSARKNMIPELVSIMSPLELPMSSSTSILLQLSMDKVSCLHWHGTSYQIKVVSITQTQQPI